MNLQPEESNLISLFVRNLKSGKTYSDFHKAWYPDKGFGIPVRVLNAVNINDESEILSIGFMKLPENKLKETMQRISEQESIRHDKISEVIESTTIKGIYKIVNDDDLS